MAAPNYLAQLLANTSMGTGGVQAPVGGAPAPTVTAAVPQPTSPADPAAAIAALLKGGKAYGNDALLEGARTGMDQGSASAPSGLSLVGDPSVSTHGKHAGQAHFTVDMGGGMRANVYYDENGQRQVEKYRAS